MTFLVFSAVLPGCGCGSWAVTVPGGESWSGAEACGWEHGAALEYRPSADAPFVVDLGTWRSPPELDTLVNKMVIAAEDVEQPGEVPFEATMSWSDGAGEHHAELVGGTVTVVRPRADVEDVLLYDELSITWDIELDGADGLWGHFRGRDALRVVKP